MNEETISQLEKQVQILIDWKNSRKKERLVSPIDSSSRKTLDYWKVSSSSGSVTGLFRSTGKILSVDYINLTTNDMTYAVQISINGKLTDLIVALKILPFTANASTDTFTNTNGQHNMSNGEIITLTTDTALPTPLAINTNYYIINRTGNTFQLSTSSGGSAINITDAGSGLHYYAKLT